MAIEISCPKDPTSTHGTQITGMPGLAPELNQEHPLNVSQLAITERHLRPSPSFPQRLIIVMPSMGFSPPPAWLDLQMISP
jgi:hypothetical protein